MQAGREIKFQAYDQESKKMWSWEDIIEAESAMFITLLDILRHDQFIKRQYTGLRDKNGKEIYEDDIVVVEHVLLEYVSPYRTVIEWDKYRFCMRSIGKADYAAGIYPINNLDPFGLNFEVIGNIYENPELLQAG